MSGSHPPQLGMPQGVPPPFPPGGMPGASHPGSVPHPPPGHMPNGGLNPMMQPGARPSPGARPPLSVTVPSPSSHVPPGGHPGVVPLGNVPLGNGPHAARPPGPMGFGPAPGTMPPGMPPGGPGQHQPMGGPPRPGMPPSAMGMQPPGMMPPAGMKSMDGAPQGFGAPQGMPPPGMAHPPGSMGMAPPGPSGMMQHPGGLAPPGMVQHPGGLAPPGMMQQQQSYGAPPGMMQQQQSNGPPQGMMQRPGGLAPPGMMQQPQSNGPPPGMMQQVQPNRPHMMTQSGPHMTQQNGPHMMAQSGPHMTQQNGPHMMPPSGHGGPPPNGMGQQQNGGGMLPPPPMGFDPYQSQRNAANVAVQFESLTLGAPGPGMPDGVNLAAMPRPVGDYKAIALAAQPLTDPSSCSADNMRLTVTCVPNSAALRSRWSLPLGLIVQPMADENHGRQVPVLNLGASGIVRCRRCRTYINPFVQWTDNGRRYKCNVCSVPNEVPPEYFCNLDHNGHRRDREERPELSCGTVEYIAPSDYMVRPPMPPVFFFVIDVSSNAMSCGMVAAATNAIKSCLDSLPGDERTLVGLITYDSTIHFHNLKPSLASPQMLVVAELDDPFVPLQTDDLLVNLAESRSLIESVLAALPATFASNQVVDSAMGPALQAAYMVMSHVGGKLLLFQSSVPSAGPGKMRSRENISLYGTEREPTMRNPDDAFFKRFAAECSRVQITVDVFATSLQYMDLASLASIPRFTSGELYYYPGFDATRDSEKLHHEVVRNLTRPTAWEAVMRIRCSKGLRVSSYHGHFFNRTTDLLALPTCDPDKGYAVQVALEENTLTNSTAYVQCALLYTSSDGERRIRVHTLSVPVVSELNDLYKGCDSAALACILAKLAVEKSLTSRLDETRNLLQSRITAVLKEFRLLNSSSSARAPNKLIYPDSLRFLPLWSLGILKTAALRGGAKDVNADERMAVGHEIMSSTVSDLCRLAYPSLYPLHDPSGDWGMEGSSGSDGMEVALPRTMALSLTQLSDMGAYLMDNGRVFILWLGRMLHKDWGTDVFGVDIHALADPSQVSLEPARDTAISKRICAVLKALRARRRVYQQCFVVRQGSPLEVHVLPYFVEDRSQSAASYSDYMVSMHKGVTSK